MKQTRLDLALRELQNLHAMVLSSGDIWAPGVSVPDYVRKEVRSHRRAVQLRMAQASIYVCPAPNLHRANWSYESGRFQCPVCARLDRFVAG